MKGKRGGGAMVRGVRVECDVGNGSNAIDLWLD